MITVMSLLKIFYKHFWWDLKWKISIFFNPKQDWFLSKIPDYEIDGSELLKISCFQTLLHFIDDLDGINSNTWDWSEERIRCKEELLRAYDLITYSIPYAENKANNFIKTQKPVNFNSVKELSNYLNNDDGLKTYSSMLQVVEDMEQQACELIIKNRNALNI